MARSSYHGTITLCLFLILNCLYSCTLALTIVVQGDPSTLSADTPFDISWVRDPQTLAGRYIIEAIFFGNPPDGAPDTIPLPGKQILVPATGNVNAGVITVQVPKAGAYKFRVFNDAPPTQEFTTPEVVTFRPSTGGGPGPGNSTSAATTETSTTSTSTTSQSPATSTTSTATSSSTTAKPTETSTRAGQKSTTTTPNRQEQTESDADPTQTNEGLESRTDEPLPTETASDSASNAANGATSKQAPTGAIVGGVVGGIAVLLALIAFIVIRRRRRKEVTFNREMMVRTPGGAAYSDSPIPPNQFRNDGGSRESFLSQEKRPNSYWAA